MSYCYQFVNTKHSKYLRWKKYSVYLFMKLIWNENKLLTSCLSYSSFWDKSFLLNYHHYLYNLLTFGRCRRGWIDTLHLKEFQISHVGGLLRFFAQSLAQALFTSTRFTGLNLLGKSLKCGPQGLGSNPTSTRGIQVKMFSCTQSKVSGKNACL